MSNYALIFGMAFLAVGLIAFMAGYGMFDLGHNLKYINAEFGLYLVDTNNHGELMEPKEMISQGINQMLLGLVSSLAGAFMLGTLVEK